MTIDMLESLSRLRPLNSAEVLQLHWLIKREKKNRRHANRAEEFNARRRERYASDPDYAERRKRENRDAHLRRAGR